MQRFNWHHRNGRPPSSAPVSKGSSGSTSRPICRLLAALHGQQSCDHTAFLHENPCISLFKKQTHGFSTYLDPIIDGLDYEPTDEVHFELLADVAETIIQLATHDKVTINNMIEELNKKRKEATPQYSEQAWLLMMQKALFILVGCLSMAYQPDLTTRPNEPALTELSGKTNVRPKVSFWQISDRPIGTALQLFGQILPPPRHFTQHPTTQSSLNIGVYRPILHRYSVCAASLRALGKVQIRWTDSLSSHLHFNGRHLLMYRWPSYCALGLEPSDSKTVFDWWVKHCEVALGAS